MEAVKEDSQQIFQLNNPFDAQKFGTIDGIACSSRRLAVLERRLLRESLRTLDEDDDEDDDGRDNGSVAGKIDNDTLFDKDVGNVFDGIVTKPETIQTATTADQSRFFEENDASSSNTDYSATINNSTEEGESISWIERKTVELLMSDALYDTNDQPYFTSNTIRSQLSLPAILRRFFWNPILTEFTAIQLSSWAALIGIAMGLFTAVWHWWIQIGIKVLWEELPLYLYNQGIFTDVNGSFPMYHYIWIIPTIFGGLLSYLHCILTVKIPTQDEWIKRVHEQGVDERYQSFFPLFFYSSAAMWSGLVLGPELPLILTGGMVGSWIGIYTEQTILQARVLNLTAASAAISAFFGFPMAGALFVLEVPHRMGLQYFEALSPATISSIVGVLVSRIVLKNDVTGYFAYPLLEETLPSTIFGYAIVYGLYGCTIGILYVEIVKFMKASVHGWFHTFVDNDKDPSTPITTTLMADKNDKSISERTPLVPQQEYVDGDKATGHTLSKSPHTFNRWCCCYIKDEPTRAAVAGMFAGAIVGVIGVFVPHALFFGEGQLQSLIDGGRTPLPIFTNSEDNPVRDLTHLAYCIVDPNDADAMKIGFGASCSLVLTLARTITTGLSLGTGIIGGQFWGPLCVGCSAAHFFSAVFSNLSERYGFGAELAAYPCIAIVCTMASTHVGIMLILTLSISAFKPEGPGESNKAGDYSAVFPLLVIAVFTALMSSSGTTFYPSQTSRGDIVAVPEILCRPGRTGNPIVTQFGGSDSDCSSHCTINSDVDRSNVSARSRKSRFLSSPVPSTVRRESFPIPLNLSPLNTDFMELTAVQSQQPPPPPPNESPSLASGRTYERDNSLSRFMKDREYKRTESYTPPSSYRKHDDNTGYSSSTNEKKVRHQTFGNLDGRQRPSLLDQARNNSNHAVTQQHHMHRRTLSNPSSYSFSDASQSSR